MNVTHSDLLRLAKRIETATVGPKGADGVGVPVGGTTGQVLKKTSATDYATEWADDLSGVTGPSTSVDGNLVLFDGTDGAAIKDSGRSVTELLTMLQTGWNPAAETWTRTGNNTFTVSGDVTSRYAAKDKFKLTNGTVKYGFFTSVTYSEETGLTTITTSLETTLAVGAITDAFYSKIANPQGFPYSYAKLFDGSWNSSTATVVGSIAYNEYNIEFSGANTIARAFKKSNAIRGVGGFVSATPTPVTDHFGATFSGDVWTWGYAIDLQHLTSTGHNAGTALAVSVIYGVM